MEKNNNESKNVSDRLQIRVSEILQLKNRLREINNNEISNIDFLDDNGLPIQIEKKNIDDWKFTGLNITDFIDSNFYIDGFTVCVKTPVEISRVAPDRPNFSVTSGKTIIITKIISNNNVDFLLYPSLTLVVNRKDGKSFKRPIVSYITSTKNSRVVDINESFNIGEGLLVEIENNKKNVDFNLSIYYSIN